MVFTKRKCYLADLFGNTSTFNVVFFMPSISQSCHNNFYLFIDSRSRDSAVRYFYCTNHNAYAT